MTKVEACLWKYALSKKKFWDIPSGDKDRLKELSFTVIQFKDEEVLHQINMVRENIEGWVNKLNEEL
ncbi:hypothetical protein [Owenweeksia hongkongensis]|uniref:hypothetical protein n=1 Tax=Owenweeksia hongkongensis TaxID=253245 RepID=UPI003A913ACF